MQKDVEVENAYYGLDGIMVLGEYGDFYYTSAGKLKDDFIEIPTSISGKSTEQKIAKLQNKLKDDEVLIVSSLEDVSYLLNLISYNFEYSSVIFGKIIITKALTIRTIFFFVVFKFFK